MQRECTGAHEQGFYRYPGPAPLFFSSKISVLNDKLRHGMHIFKFNFNQTWCTFMFLMHSPSTTNAFGSPSLSTLFVNNALNCNSKCFLFFQTISWQTLKMQTEKHCQVMSILELWEAKEPDVSAISFKKITRVKPILTATWCVGKIKKKQSVAVARHARLVESAVIAMHLFRDHKHSRHWNCVVGIKILLCSIFRSVLLLFLPLADI